MQSQDAASAAKEIFKVLEPFGSEERLRIVSAVLTLLGENSNPVPGSLAAAATSTGVPIVDKVDEQTYFSEKDPKTKIEELAVAARFREQQQDSEAHDKDSLGAIIKAARRNFDSKNYNRDINNAKTAGFFNKGAELTLSYYGQQFVDALPDRDAAKSIRRPTKGRKPITKKKKTKSK